MLTDHHFEAASRRAQVAAGLALLVFGVLATIYSFRDLVWWYSDYRLWDVDPGVSAVVLALAPVVLLLGLRLVFGGQDGRALAPPVILGVMGAGLIVGCALYFLSVERDWRMMEIAVVGGGGALVLAWRRLRIRKRGA